ncbi:MAG: YhdP family protein, partial [Vibrio sp.]
LDKPELEIETSRTLIGRGKPGALARKGVHQLDVVARQINLDPWIEFLSAKNGPVSKAKSKQSLLDLPAPNLLKAQVNRVTVADMSWHRLNLTAKQNGSTWNLDVNAKEIEGKGQIRRQGQTQNFGLNLSRLHLNLPKDEQAVELKEKPKKTPRLTEQEKQIFAAFPNLDLKVKNLWLQGYKLGQLDMKVMREQDRLDWKTFKLVTGTNQLDIKGWWQVKQDKTRSSFNIDISGDNNSDLMARFGINSGLQQAKFALNSKLRWQGTPWAIYPNTLYGDLDTKFDDGVISGVNSGAVKLLGIFSLDSIMRKMRLDFTGVFDDGLAFRSITGTGQIAKGLFVTNDLKMKAVAGDMMIKGQADLDQRLVDAEVTFIPDLTSSIPILTAFAVSPPTAVAVFAITKVLTPVVDVITKVQYGVKGSLDSPQVTELSRTRGEYELPKQSVKKLAPKKAD